MFKCLLCLFFSVPVFAQHHHASSDPHNIYISTMDSMMMNMDTVRQLQIADIDFLRLMIPHHQGAVNMSLHEVAHGDDKKMVELARSIIAEQQFEIAMMHALLPSIEKTSPTLDLSKEWSAAMHSTMVAVPSEPSSDIDMAFAEVMIPHHQAGIEMAKIVLARGKHKAVLRLAERMISSQQIEIEQMKQYLK